MIYKDKLIKQQYFYEQGAKRSFTLRLQTDNISLHYNSNKLRKCK